MSNAAAPATEGPDRTDGPLHVAIIMDGNGRWAAARGLPRAEGHRRGVDALRRVVRAAGELGILYLTIFSFSSENWSRPATEIGDLFGLLRRFIRNDLATLHRDGVRVRVIGERDGLEPDICALLSEAEELTKGNTKLNLVVAFNYGSRQEIAHAAQRLALEVAEGKRDPASIDADTLGRYLDAPDIPDPDLIIRTSGEQRLSNFLMWQAAYSELVFVPIHWPDFDKAALEGAIAEYARRDRPLRGMADHRRRRARDEGGCLGCYRACRCRILSRLGKGRCFAPRFGPWSCRRRVAFAAASALGGDRIFLCRRGGNGVGAGAPRPGLWICRADPDPSGGMGDRYRRLFCRPRSRRT